MENWYNHILTDSQLRIVCTQIELLKNDLKKRLEWHTILSKYKDEYWFQKAIPSETTKEEAYYLSAKRIDQIEAELAEYQEKISNHSNAVNYRNNRPHPFEGVNLQTEVLIQTSMF